MRKVKKEEKCGIETPFFFVFPIFVFIMLFVSLCNYNSTKEKKWVHAANVLVLITQYVQLIAIFCLYHAPLLDRFFPLTHSLQSKNAPPTAKKKYHTKIHCHKKRVLAFLLHVFFLRWYEPDNSLHLKTIQFSC